jgi:hypothetical protein
MTRTSEIYHPGREVYSIWYGSETEAQGAVLEARAMNAGTEVAA